MFSRRRRNYRVFVVVALIISICTLIIAILWPDKPVDRIDDVNVNTEANINENDEENPIVIPEGEQETSTDSNDATYYIVKKNGTLISVYFVTEEGTQVKLEDTEILYDLLPLEDQANFDKGIVVEGQEELSSLLQDFEG